MTWACRPSLAFTQNRETEGVVEHGSSRKRTGLRSFHQLSKRVARFPEHTRSSTIHQVVCEFIGKCHIPLQFLALSAGFPPWRPTARTEPEDGNRKQGADFPQKTAHQCANDHSGQSKKPLPSRYYVQQGKQAQTKTQQRADSG